MSKPEVIREVTVTIRQLSDGDWSIIPATERDSKMDKGKVLVDFFKYLDVDSDIVDRDDDQISFRAKL